MGTATAAATTAAELVDVAFRSGYTRDGEVSSFESPVAAAALKDITGLVAVASFATDNAPVAPPATLLLLLAPLLLLFLSLELRPSKVIDGFLGLQSIHNSKQRV